MSLDNTCLPVEDNNMWVMGAGMYHTDLITEYHEYRELWQTHHTTVRPTVADGSKPAIGVFLHKHKTYDIMLNGLVKSFTV